MWSGLLPADPARELWDAARRVRPHLRDVRRGGRSLPPRPGRWGPGRASPRRRDRALRRRLVEAPLGQGRAGDEGAGHAGAALPAAPGSGRRRSSCCACGRSAASSAARSPPGSPAGPPPRRRRGTGARSGTCAQDWQEGFPALPHPAGGRKHASRARGSMVFSRFSRELAGAGAAGQRVIYIAWIDYPAARRIDEAGPRLRHALRALGLHRQALEAARLFAQAVRTIRILRATRPDAVWVQSPPGFLPHSLLMLRRFTGGYADRGRRPQPRFADPAMVAGSRRRLGDEPLRLGAGAQRRDAPGRRSARGAAGTDPACSRIRRPVLEPPRRRAAVRRRALRAGALLVQSRRARADPGGARGGAADAPRSPS